METENFVAGECGTVTNSYVTYGTGNGAVRRVTTTTREYDAEGNLTKETVVETEYEKPVGITYPPYQTYPYPYWSQADLKTKISGL